MIAICMLSLRFAKRLSIRIICRRFSIWTVIVDFNFSCDRSAIGSVWRDNQGPTFNRYR